MIKWAAIAGFALAAIGVATVALIFWMYGRDASLPNLRSVADYKPLQVTRVAASDGTVIGEIYTERRSFIPYEEVPPMVVNAFVSAEDAKFFDHEGIDYMGMLRAFVVNLRARETKQGASTITQQVVKTFFLTPERTFRRKIQEIILARRLESKLTKEEILTLYLNQIYFGGGRYGLKEAARYYFGKEVVNLDVGEAALIAGLPQSPENISPKKSKNRQRAKARQKYVLEQMAHHGYISYDVAKQFIDAPIRVVKDPYPNIGVAPEWVEIARQHLIAQRGEAALDTLGVTVTTTLDLNIQRVATEALRAGLRAVDERRKYGRTVRKVKPDKIDLEVAKLARRLPQDGPKRGERYSAVIRGVFDAKGGAQKGAKEGAEKAAEKGIKNAAAGELEVDLGKWQASVMLGGDGDARYNPEGKKPTERFQIGDVIRVMLPPPGDLPGPKPQHSERQVVLAPGPQGAVVVLDPATRRVHAVVGGYDGQIGDFNRALQAKRQPGSTFKPFVYAAAIDSGTYTAASIVNDAPEVYDLWKPQNYKKGQFSGPVRLRMALARSINTVAIRVLHDVGPAKVVELAHKLGISSELPAELSLALGSGEVTPLEMTNAFASFAAGGVAAPPRFVDAIDGESVAASEGEPALRPEVAYIIIDMMRSVVTEGTAGGARKLGLPVAGKTGTSNDARDAWFMGMTPGYAVGVWIGFDDNEPLGRGEAGGRTALPVFVSLMEEIGDRERGRNFRKPPGLVSAKIDRASGLLAPDGARSKDVYTEVFLDGSAPTEVALAPGEAAASDFVLDAYDDAYGDDDDSDSGGDGE